jgi:hypothetical protein
MEQGYRQEPPTDNQHGMSHSRSTTVDDQVDDQQKAENSGDDHGSANDLSPCLAVPERFASAPLSSIAVSRRFQTEGKHP